MTRFSLRAVPAALVLATAAAASAQQPNQAAQVPTARPLGATTGTIAEAFGGVQAVRELPDGRVLVNDPTKRRVVLFDADLSKFTVVADSTSATATAYSGRMAGLIPYRADSTLFVDPQSLSMLVIDPKGTLGTRVMSVPKPDDAMSLTGIAFGMPGFDAQGRLIYRPSPRFEMRRGPGGPGGGPGGGGAANGGRAGGPPQMPDTAPIVRVELATRKMDTVAFVKTYAPRMQITQLEGGGMSMTSKLDPLPLVDDWAVLADGTVMILRGREFRVDLVGKDGKLVAGPKVAHDWQRMSDEDKVAFLDSTKTAMEKVRAAAQAAMSQPGGMQRAMETAGAAMGMGGGGMPMVSIQMRPDGGEPPRRGGQGGGPNGGMQMPTLTFVDPSELPDYKPPFAAGGARADADGNVWVRLIATKPMPGPVYDIIDKDGKLVDRVVLPAGAAIAGFGKGSVFLATRNAEGTHLTRVRVK